MLMNCSILIALFLIPTSGIVTFSMPKVKRVASPWNRALSGRNHFYIFRKVSIKMRDAFMCTKVRSS